MDGSEFDEIFGMEDLLSRSDDNNDETIKKNEERLETLIQTVKIRYGCSYENALVMIQMNPKWLSRCDISHHNFKKFQLSGIDGRTIFKENIRKNIDGNSISN